MSQKASPQQLAVAAENKVSERRLDRKTAEKKESRCQPSSRKHVGHTVKSRFLPFSQSSKTMASWRLIRWVIEGVRALPSALSRSLPSCVSLSNARPLFLLLAVSHHVSSLVCCRAPNACWINAYQWVRNPAQPSPAPVEGDWISNYLLNSLLNSLCNYLPICVTESIGTEGQKRLDFPDRMSAFFILWK